MFNNDIIIATGIALGFCIVVFFMNKNKINLNYITELKLALLIAGMSFKDSKMKSLADILMSIVVGLENINISSQEKKAKAMKKAIVEIYDKLKIKLDDFVLSTIIDIAVSHMKENK